MSYLQVALPTTYIPIGGTNSWGEDANNMQWWERGSVFTRHLSTQNLILHARNPFCWDTSVDGLFFQRKHMVWKAASKHLQCHLEGVPLDHRNLIAHSHSGQIVFYMLANGVRINNLITVGTPVRADMESIILKGLGNIGYWHHIYDSKTDVTAILGTLFDGKIRIKHKFDLADGNSDIKGIGHSKILNDEKHIKLWNWDSEGWASLLAYGKGAQLHV